MSDPTDESADGDGGPVDADDVPPGEDGHPTGADADGPDSRDGPNADGPEGRDDPDADAAALDPADAFSLLGDATRLQIVTTLHERDPPIPFSALYEASDVGDTGQFNYHLDQLVPHFVERGDHGYAPTSAGERIARAVFAGLYTDRPTLEPFSLAGDCYACGEAELWGAYEDEQFLVECRACDTEVLRVKAPPSLVRGRSPGAFVAAFDRWSWTGVEQAILGVCPECGGAVERSIDDRPDGTVGMEATARFDCTVCGRVVQTSFGGVAVTDPTVRSFFERRGESVRERPYWTVEQFVSDEHVEVVSRDPWRVRVSFVADGDACHVAIDGDLEVVEATVVPGGAPASGPDDERSP